MNDAVDKSFENCLWPLLTALEWRGSQTTLKEAMPHVTAIESASIFCSIFENLNFEVTSLTIDVSYMDERLLPVFMVTEDNKPWVILSINQEAYTIFDGTKNKEIILDNQKFTQLLSNSRAYFFKSRERQKKLLEPRGWFWSTVKQNKSLLYSALFLSLMLSFFMLATPIFVMSIYDVVIGASSYVMLIEFTAGIIIALIGIYWLYKIRAQHLAILGAHFGKAIGNQIMSQLLYLAPLYTETATAGAQVARIRDFDKVREFVSGPMLSVFFDMPFIIIGLIIVGLLGKYLVFVPLLMLLFFIAITFGLTKRIKSLVSQSATSFSELQEFLLEALDSIRIIKYTGSVPYWIKRYQEQSAAMNLLSIKLTFYDGISASLSEAVMIISGVFILTIGAWEVMNEKLEIGMLLAVMIIVWRILAPIKAMVSALPRLIQILSSIRQIDKLMTLKPETLQMTRVKKGKISFEGAVSFIRVSMRYPGAYNPSLLGVAFDVAPGEFIAITGRNGSGKSTLLKLLLGLYQPQAGAVLIDGQNIGQLNPLDLRRSIAYLPQKPELFYGTIEDNLRLGDPTVSLETMMEACANAGVLEAIQKLPEGFNTRIQDHSSKSLSLSFSQSLCLARAYLRETAILLLDEPSNALDAAADSQLIQYLVSLRGKRTILMVTHRPSHLQKADKVFLMDQGQLVIQAPPDEILKNIPINLL